MALDNDQKFLILADLANGFTPTEIATNQKVSYATVLRYKAEFEKAKANNELGKILDLSAVARKQLADQVISQAPEALQSAVEGEIKSLLASTDMSDILKINLQASANKIADRINVLINQAQNSSEVLVLAEALCDLQNAFFNKNQTQVNVQNNYGAEASKYGTLLSDTPS